MKKMIFIQLLILLPILSHSQEEKVPDQMLCSPVLLISEFSQGSGFFMNDSNNVFFVTCRHNLFKIDIKPKIRGNDTIFSLSLNSGNLLFYPHNIVTEEPAIINIDILGCYKDSLIKFDKNHDVAIIKIANIEKFNDSIGLVRYINHIEKNRTTHIQKTSIRNVKMYKETNIGGEIFLFGYPGSIGIQQSPQFDYYRPLLRKGIIAGKYEKTKTLIIDSPTYYGNSGGPVFELFEMNFTKEAYLIGFVSEYIPYVDEWVNTKNGLRNIQMMNSGYTIITPIDYAVKLIENYK